MSLDTFSSRAQLAHADDPQLHRLALAGQGRAVAAVQLFAGVAAGVVQGQFGQLGHSAGDVAQGRTRFAVQADEPLRPVAAPCAGRWPCPHPARAGRPWPLPSWPGWVRPAAAGLGPAHSGGAVAGKARMLGLPVTGRNGGAGEGRRQCSAWQARRSKKAEGWGGTRRAQKACRPGAKCRSGVAVRA